MKTLELMTSNKPTNGDESNDRPETVILTYGQRPVAAMLPDPYNLSQLVQFEQLIREEETVTLTLNGKPIAILQTLVPLVVIDDDSADLETVTLSLNAQFLDMIEHSRQRHESEGGISSTEMRQRLGL